MMYDQRKKTEVNELEGSTRLRLSHTGRTGNWIRDLVAKLVVQEVEKFRSMTKPRCVGEG